MELTPDTHILFEISGIPFNATIVNSWVVMVVITAIARLVTWNLRPDVAASRWRTALEVIVKGIESQISEITGKPSGSLLARCFCLLPCLTYWWWCRVSIRRPRRFPPRPLWRLVFFLLFRVLVLRGMASAAICTDTLSHRLLCFPLILSESFLVRSRWQYGSMAM